jgi:hypothetical protein
MRTKRGRSARDALADSSSVIPVVISWETLVTSRQRIWNEGFEAMLALERPSDG